MCSVIRVVNETGRARDTKVFMGENELSGITKVIMYPLLPDKLVQFEVTFVAAKFELFGHSRIPDYKKPDTRTYEELVSDIHKQLNETRGMLK